MNTGKAFLNIYTENGIVNIIASDEPKLKYYFAVIEADISIDNGIFTVRGKRLGCILEYKFRTWSDCTDFEVTDFIREYYNTDDLETYELTLRKWWLFGKKITREYAKKTFLWEREATDYFLQTSVFVFRDNTKEKLFVELTTKP